MQNNFGVIKLWIRVEKFRTTIKNVKVSGTFNLSITHVSVHYSKNFTFVNSFSYEIQLYEVCNFFCLHSADKKTGGKRG